MNFMILFIHSWNCEIASIRHNKRIQNKTPFVLAALIRIFSDSNPNNSTSFPVYHSHNFIRTIPEKGVWRPQQSWNTLFAPVSPAPLFSKPKTKPAGPFSIWRDQRLASINQSCEGPCLYLFRVRKPLNGLFATGVWTLNRIWKVAL